ncbi:hypothetical protein [Nostoc sp. FACHB-145]|uniref:hypothetical protein n=1 Tax=Nostoc sp. FACHB-145 TaxID=2692836 RepID=UPI00168630DA|nr:hypothetical protein [Nostoc sp. FACHB-145]MBD2471522.1 hypothetical protein [Nostoc sp. FACHB-145]
MKKLDGKIAIVTGASGETCTSRVVFIELYQTAFEVIRSARTYSRIQNPEVKQGVHLALGLSLCTSPT